MKLLGQWRNFQCSSAYWQIRHAFQHLVFRVRRLLFYLLSFLREKRRSSSVLANIIRTALRALILSSALFVVAAGLGPFLRWCAPILHGFLLEIAGKLFAFFASTPALTLDGYISLIGGLASIAGVFLGLYFAAISIGISQQVDRLSPNLRQIIVTEKTGTLYITMLTTLTLLCLLLWFNASVFHNYSIFSAAFVLVFSLFLVGAFYPLGRQSFFLADPTTLAVPIFQEMHATLRKLKKCHSLYGYGPFQAHYQKLVLYQLSTVSELLELALKSNAKDKQYVTNLIANLISQTLFYHQFKPALSKDSPWFQRKPIHDDWLYQDDAKLQMLQIFGASTEPTLTPDADWFEANIAILINQPIDYFSKTRDVEGLSAVLDLVRRYVISLASSWQTKLAIDTFKAIHERLTDFIQNTDISLHKRLIVTESYAIMSIDIVQQTFKRVVECNPRAELDILADKLVRSPSSNAWMKSTPAVKSTAEALAHQVVFEKRIENQIKSPKWYLMQVLARAYSIEAKEAFKALVGLFETTKIPDGRDGDYNAAATRALLLQRQIEVAKRLFGQRKEYNSFTKKLKETQLIPEVEIEVLAIDYLEKELKEQIDAHYDLMADLILSLFQQSRDHSLPDFFGLAYQQLTDELYRKAEEDDGQRYLDIFTRLLASAFCARDRLQAEYAASPDALGSLKITFDPILDLMHLSAYTVLFSEIHSTHPFSESVLMAWDKLLDTLALNLPKTEWLTKYYELVQKDFRITKGSTRRFQWTMRFRNVLASKGYIRERLSSYDENVVQPGTPYLKVLCAGGYEPIEDMGEVFLTAWLIKNNVDKNVMRELPFSFVKDFIRQGEREKISEAGKKKK